MGNVQEQIKQAKALELAQNHRAALDAYLRVSQEPGPHVEDPGFWLNLAEAARLAKQQEPAAEAYSRAVDLLAKAGSPNSAIAVARRLVRVAPGLASGSLRYGQLAVDLGYAAFARDAFLSAADAAPANGDLEAVVAGLRTTWSLLREQGLEGDAETVRARIVQISPGSDPAAGHAAAPTDAAPDAGADLIRGDDLPGLGTGRADSDGALAPVQGLGDDFPPLEGLDDAFPPLEPLDDSPPDLPAPRAAAEHGLLDDLVLDEPTGGGIGDIRLEEDAATGDALAFEPDEPRTTGRAPPPGEVPPAAPRPATTGEPPARRPETSPASEEEFLGFEPEPQARAEPAQRPKPEPEPPAPPAPERPERPEQGPEAEPSLPDLEREDTPELPPLPGMEPDSRPESEPALPPLPDLGPVDARSTDDDLDAIAPPRDLPSFGGDAAGTASPSPKPGVAGSGPEPRPAGAPPTFGRGREVREGGEPWEHPPRVEEPEAAPPPAPEEDYIDLAALILGDEVDSGTRFLTDAAGPPSGDEDRDFAEILNIFRKQVSEKIHPQDSSSHYDLGVAYKEMGLLDDAIAQLQLALRAGANPVATLEVIGECFIEKSEPTLAKRVLERATEVQVTADADLVGVLYWLGRCEEVLASPAEARGHYERVVAVDISFRDAAQRLRDLRGGAAR